MLRQAVRFKRSSPNTYDKYYFGEVIFLVSFLTKKDFHCHLSRGSRYTLTSFHFPRLNKMKLATVMAVSATGIAMNTPSGPIFKDLARK
ncbi:hypothetical protein SAMN02927903_01952 [Flavobacterium caeni]|uniref:Uncharacterized protein n=1 Tax=Flavobacterium caeni TaxID=490189 RepID=A0A1G5HRK2_9FLAO|nr:hypothetical protein SAMN02927903_01952 [Flavobacterium caeni]